MAQPSYPARGGFSSRVPERTVPSSSQPQFGQSAPGFGRQVQYPQQPPPQQSTYGFNRPYDPRGGFGATKGQVSGQVEGMSVGLEKDNNLMNDLSDEQKEEIQEAFSVFDVNQDRHLDFHEFKTALRALGFRVEKEELVQLMNANGVSKPNLQNINTGRRGQQPVHVSQLLMPQQSFTRIAAQKMNERDPLEEVERAFYLFDAEQKGYITIDDLRRVARELGETSLEEQELATMIEEFDYDGRGGISKDSFFSICMQ